VNSSPTCSSILADWQYNTPRRRIHPFRGRAWIQGAMCRHLGKGVRLHPTRPARFATTPAAPMNHRARPPCITLFMSMQWKSSTHTMANAACGRNHDTRTPRIPVLPPVRPEGQDRTAAARSPWQREPATEAVPLEQLLRDVADLDAGCVVGGELRAGQLLLRKGGPLAPRW
jgi:hypothetical protein